MALNCAIMNPCCTIITQHQTIFYGVSIWPGTATYHYGPMSWHDCTQCQDVSMGLFHLNSLKVLTSPFLPSWHDEVGIYHSHAGFHIHMWLHATEIFHLNQCNRTIFFSFNIAFQWEKKWKLFWQQVWGQNQVARATAVSQCRKATLSGHPLMQLSMSERNH